MRVGRASALALAFLCIGSVSLMGLLAILTICVIAFAEGVNPMPLAVGMARDQAWPLLIVTAAMAGVTGVIAGIYELLFGRANARAVLIISSLVVSFEPLILEMARTGSVRVTWIDLGIQTIGLLWFNAGIMACWKMIDVVRGKNPGRRRRAAV